MSKDSKAEKGAPMDPGVREVAVPVVATNNRRVCWAIKQLVKEVTELFPETSMEYSNYDGRNTALDVTFDFSMLDQDEYEVARALLDLIGDEKRSMEAWTRVDQVIDGGGDMSGQMLVSMKAGPHTQDDHTPFGLGDAYLVLTEDVQ